MSITPTMRATVCKLVVQTLSENRAPPEANLLSRTKTPLLPSFSMSIDVLPTPAFFSCLPPPPSSTTPVLHIAAWLA